ncbi:MAG: outer membrane protein assembly factor BamD [Burkholderiaceae bacterium]
MPYLTWIAAVRRALLLITTTAVLAACGTGEGPDITAGWPPEKLYADARDELNSGNWQQAIKQLEKLESRYPFGKWAQQAQIDLAYANYKEGDRALALAAVDRFMKLHPNHPQLDYAYYLKGLINFNEQQGFMASLGGQDLSERDLRAARDAFDAFREVVTRWPDSRYADDAHERMRYLVNTMAQGEVKIARYYFDRAAYVAAANRAESVVKLYQQTPAVEQALYILMVSYDKLGMKDLQQDAERVFKANFPDSPLLRDGIARVDRKWYQFWR